MTTPTQNQAAITAAIQAAATADLSLLNTFASANGAGFNTLSNNLATLASQMSDLARQEQVQTIQSALQGVLGQFQTLISNTTAAETATPVA